MLDNVGLAYLLQLVYVCSGHALCTLSGAGGHTWHLVLDYDLASYIMVQVWQQLLGYSM